MMNIKVVVYDESEKIIHNGHVVSASFILTKLIKKDSASIEVDLVKLPEGISYYKHSDRTFKIDKKTWL